MRLLGIDYGKKRIGLAICDPQQTTALPLTTLENTPKTQSELQSIITDYTITELIIGLPKNAKGQSSDIAKQVKSFAEKTLSPLNLPINYIDERFTTQEAARGLHAAGLNSKKQKGKLDALADTYILQTHLDIHQKSE